MAKEFGSTARTFARMALEMHQEQGVEETVDAVIQFALQAIDCNHAGLVLIDEDGVLQVGAVTDPEVRTADAGQLPDGDWPAMTVLTEGHDSVLVADTADENRWPAWAAGMLDLGLRSVLAVRLHANGTALGVLLLADRKPYAFARHDIEVAHILAQHASVAVASAQHEASLWQAVDSRKLIGQAQGILMERFSVDAAQAFAMLRRYSQNHNVKLREVARLLTQTRRLPD